MRLLAATVQISRQPGFYGPGRVPDSLEGRTEVLTLAAGLALIRLQAAGAEAQPLSQHFADALFRHFDAGLREAGVGDLSVAKRMRRLASAFYGRLSVYAPALEAGDQSALEAALARNVLGAETGAFAAQLARFAAESHALQEQLEPAALARLDGWAPAPA